MGKLFVSVGGGGADTDVVTAGAGDVLLNKVIVGLDGEPLTGTMPNNGAVAPSALGAGGSYTIPEGYHNGSGKVTAKDLASQTVGNAVANHIVSGENAWVNGIQVVGTMAVQSAFSFSCATLSSTAIRIQWYNPSVGPWEGVFIQMSTGGYPGTSGGTRVYTGVGMNPVAGAYNYVDIGGLEVGTTYYFTCTSYCNALGWGVSENIVGVTVGYHLYSYGYNPANFTSNQFTFSADRIVTNNGSTMRANIMDVVQVVPQFSRICIDFMPCNMSNITQPRVGFEVRVNDTILAELGMDVALNNRMIASMPYIITPPTSITSMTIRYSTLGASNLFSDIYRIWLE